ncbi:hypothetical protein [Aquitalea sp. USM4]|uniref:hypothetical protein n=1 Tax=Aquitalea sp. USM4 TaxID=1590041 RepID=UPI00103C78CE|nr:hypothetical protein [Aquitalea sp. USM4]QBJ80499.1 hypothetical protein DKK66_19820 [Aquitalea sp. USM4]
MSTPQEHEHLAAAVEQVQKEHEMRDTVTDDVFFPNRSADGSTNTARTESHYFRETKRKGHAMGLRCAISGQKDGIQYHHLFIEWALSGAVDWVTVKGVAIGNIKELPVLDPDTGQPTDETFPAEQSYLWLICKIVELRGFDWRAFDPADPAQFVDDLAQMLPLHANFHTAKAHGVHHHSGPMWGFLAFPRIPGFVYTPDELAAIKLHLEGDHEPAKEKP